MFLRSGTAAQIGPSGRSPGIPHYATWHGPTLA